MAHKQLTQEQRRAIAKGLASSMKVAVIAQNLNVHRSTVYREIQRNSLNGSYLPDEAHAMALQRHREKQHPEYTQKDKDKKKD